jgi:hydrogenase maturation factor
MCLAVPGKVIEIEGDGELRMDRGIIGAAAGSSGRVKG